MMSCSVGTTGFSGNGSASLYEWTEEGPVYGPNGLLELDPANNRCYFGQRPVFATCKNNCPGGELSVINFISLLQYYVKITLCNSENIIPSKLLGNTNCFVSSKFPGRCWWLRSPGCQWSCQQCCWSWSCWSSCYTRSWRYCSCAGRSGTGGSCWSCRNGSDGHGGVRGTHVVCGSQWSVLLFNKKHKRYSVPSLLLRKIKHFSR